MGKIIIIIIIILLILGGAFLAFFPGPGDDTVDSKTKTYPNTSQTLGTSKNKISINKSDFQPDTLEIKKGESVTWVNQDGSQHVISSDQEESGVPKFLSSNLNKGDSFTYTFNTKGTYKYHCRINPNLKGVLIIK